MTDNSAAREMTARRLLAQGFDQAETADATGLPEGQVAQLVQEAKAGPLRALLYLDRRAQRAEGHPGAVFFTDPGDGGVSAMWFICPCGCRQVSRITVGIEHKPHMAGPSWKWNGSTTEPTLHPSVKQASNGVCKGWHGWLRDGYWGVC